MKAGAMQRNVHLAGIAGRLVSMHAYAKAHVAAHLKGSRDGAK